MEVRKLFMFLLMGIFLISFAAASVQFSEAEDTYVIDTIWPTWLGGDGQSVVKMIDNTDQCLIDCSFTLEFNNEEPVNLLEDIAFVDDQGNDVSKNIETIKFTIGKYEDVEKTRPIYSEVCEDQFVLNNQTGINETQNICYDQQSGEEIYYENELVWSDYDGEQVDGLSYLKADGKKKANKRADWVITFRGEALVNWDWWDASWEYKKQITVTETSGTELLNYSELIYVPYTANMKTDFSDLRFVNSAENTEIGYYFENKSDSNYAYIWVKVPTLSASSTADVYMYYGNSGASTTSDPDEAFMHYFTDATEYSTTNTQQVIDTATFHLSDDWEYKIISATVHSSQSSYSHYVQASFGNSNIASGTDLLRTGNLDCSAGINWQGGTPCRWSSDTALQYPSHSYIKPPSYQTSFGVATFRFGHISDYSSKTGYVKDTLIIIKGYASSEPTYVIGSEISANSLVITQVSPVDYYNSTSNNVAFECNLSDETGGLSLNLTINGSVYETVTGAGSTNLSLSSTESLADGFYEWYCTGNDDTEAKNTSTRYLTVDATAPTITAATNLTDLITLTLPINSTWSFNASDDHLDQCYYNTSEQSTTVVTCNSTIQTAWATQGNKTVTSCANDTFGFETCQTDYLYVYYIAETQAEDLDPVGEGTEVTFNFTVNMTGIPSTTAYLVLNNTNYAATTSVAGSNGYYFERSVVIPDGWGSPTGNAIDWNWVYNISGVVTNENTDTTNVTVYSLSIDDCSSYGEVILNISLKDEQGNTLMFSPNSNSTLIEVDLEITATDDQSISWEYSNSWANDPNGIVAVCIPSGILTNSQYRLDYTMGFSAENYVQEFHYLDNGTLDSTEVFTTLTNKTTDLYDLLLADSTTFLFKFYDEDDLEVADALVHVFRKYIGDGVFREVERAKQDNNGETHLHLVEEDVIYYFKVSLDGQVIYTSSTYNAKCLSNPCQIELAASGDFTSFNDSWNLADGTYAVTDNPSTRIVTLSYALEDPEYVNLTIFKYTNNPDTMEVVGSDQAYSTGGTLSVTVPQVAGNVSFIAAVYQNGDIIDTEWVDFNPSGRDYFGATGVFMALLLLICLILMASSEGEGTLIFAIIGLIVISTLKLIDLDYYALVGFICAAVILVWKLAKRRHGG